MHGKWVGPGPIGAHVRTIKELALTARGAPYGKPDVVASRVGENSPPANMRDLRFGNHRFPSVRLYGGQRGIDVISREIDQ